MAPVLDELVAPGHTVLILQEIQEGVIGFDAALKELAAAAEKVGVIRNARCLANAARMAGVRVAIPA